MTNEVQIFNNPEFGEIRTVTIDNEPWFVGKDVAGALGYENPQKAVRTHVEVEDKGVTEMDTPGGKQNLAIINESGLYSLILSSKLPSAKKFKRWVTSEVLPAIRKTGTYSTMGQTFSVKDAFKMVELINITPSDRLSMVGAVLERAGIRVSDSPYEFHTTNQTANQTTPHTCNYAANRGVADFLGGVSVADKPTSDIYSQYLDYCSTYNIIPVSKIAFSKIVNRILGTHVSQKKINRMNRKVFRY